MTLKCFCILLLGLFSVGAVLGQNEEIPIENDNQFPPEISADPDSIANKFEEPPMTNFELTTAQTEGVPDGALDVALPGMLAFEVPTFPPTEYEQESVSSTANEQQIFSKSDSSTVNTIDEGKTNDMTEITPQEEKTENTSRTRAEEFDLITTDTELDAENTTPSVDIAIDNTSTLQKDITTILQEESTTMLQNEIATTSFDDLTIPFQEETTTNYAEDITTTPLQEITTRFEDTTTQQQEETTSSYSEITTTTMLQEETTIMPIEKITTELEEQTIAVSYEDTTITLQEQKIASLPGEKIKANFEEIMVASTITPQENEIGITGSESSTSIFEDFLNTLTSNILPEKKTANAPETPEIPSTNPEEKITENSQTGETGKNENMPRMLSNNIVDEKETVKLQSTVVEAPKGEEVKDTSTTTASTGGVDKSVIGIIVAAMVIIVAVIVITKNWSSIRKRFSSTPNRAHSEYSGAKTNGTASEEVPLQEKNDKSPV